MTAEPRWATPRTPGRRTLGGAIGKVSKLLGTPFMPWQQGVADVAYELNEDGQFAYDTIVVTIPRQQGKTTLVRAVNVTRPLLNARQVVIYTAQSALDARKKWEADWIPAVKASPIGSQVRVVLAPGREAMWFTPTGSRLGIVATTEQAGHGDVIDQGTIDEAFSLQDARVEQSMRPAMMTRWNLARGDLGAQLWIPSTAGILGKSPYLWDYVQRGRKAVESGVNEGLCYVEYSAPDDADPSDPATWWGCMPALGTTVLQRTVAAFQRSMKASEFARAFLNQWALSGEDPIVPLEHWQGLARPIAPRPPWVVLGLDIGPRDSAAAITAVGEAHVVGEAQAGSELQSNVIESGQGTAWLLPALARAVERYGRPYVLVDEKHCAHLLPEIERVAGFDRVRPLRVTDITAAFAFWLRLVGERKLFHAGEPELTAALVGAGQRNVGDGLAWSRVKSGADITPLVAQTLAVSFWMGSWSD